MDRIGNRYAIVVAVSKRARQLKEGARPFIDVGSSNPTTIALHEIAAGYVHIEDAVPEEEAAPDEVEVIEVTGDAERLSAVIQSLGEETQEDEAAEEEAAEEISEVEEEVVDEAKAAESDGQEKSEDDE